MNVRSSDSSPVLFCATGVKAMVGGIASANRNVLAALEAVAAESGRRTQSLVLNEPLVTVAGYRAYGNQKLRFALAAIRRLPRCAVAVFDHVHIALPILALPPAVRPPIVICAHGSESWLRIRLSSMQTFRAADLVLANSNYTLRKMRARFSGFRGVACPLGLPPQFALSLEPPPLSSCNLQLEAADGVKRALGPHVLLLVSRMDAREREKGHRELLAVLPSLIARFAETQLVFVGGGSDLPELRVIARSSTAAANIFLAGSLPTDELEALYRHSYAFVMPSRQEGFGLAYLEAMNYAKPCLACRDDGGAEVVMHEKTGLLIAQPIDPPELIEALSRLLSDRALARRYGEAGWRQLTADFSAAAHQARVAEFIRPLLPLAEPKYAPAI